MSEDKVQVLSFDDSNQIEFTGARLQERHKRKMAKQKPMTADEIFAKRKSEAEEAEYKGSEFYHGDGNSKNSIKKVKSHVLRNKLKQTEDLAKFATMSAHNAAQVLLPMERGVLEAGGINKTWQFSQSDVLENVQEGAKYKAFSLDLPEFGPYFTDYTRNGRHMLLGGRKGHLALFDWQTKKLSTEFHVQETIRDVKILHNEHMFAVAQKKYVYIYDHQGLELHVLRNHAEATKLEFLPYHYLLASVSKTGGLRYQDISVGSVVAEHRTRLGECNVMAQNPQNAILHLGHNNGSVTLWSPNMTTPLVKMHCHGAPIQALAVDPIGQHMVTSGLDGRVAVWDLRMYKELHSYFTARPATSIDISATGQLALGFGPHVQIWRNALRSKQPSPYMYEQLSGLEVSDVRFCPFEDVLAVGHSKGFRSMIVPGAGEANFDTFEANPFQTKKQRADSTVRSLLEKLQPEMITLDARAFSVMSLENEKENKDAAAAANKAANVPKIDLQRNRMKGGNKISKRERRKRVNIVDQKLMERRERIAKEEEERKKDRAKKLDPKAVPSALDRFSK